MNVRRKKLLDWELESEKITCSVANCNEIALHRAPETKDEKSNNYKLLCLIHIREFNATWNYFEGMDQNEIEKFQKSDVIGHRPTWPLGLGPLGRNSKWTLNQNDGLFEEFFTFSSGKTNFKQQRELDPEERKALAVLDLDSETTMNQIKQRYKHLVKRYHPDLNGNNIKNEEKLKTLNKAYAFLLTCNYD